MEGVLVLQQIVVPPQGCDQSREDHRPGDGVRAEAEGVAHPAVEGVLPLPDKLPGIPQPLQLLDGVGGEVGLHRQQGRVVEGPEAVHLPGKEVLVHLTGPVNGYLPACDIVDALAHEPVLVVADAVGSAGGVPAHHIGPPLLRPAVDLHRSPGAFRPPDVGDPETVVVEHELALGHRPPQLLQPPGDGHGVEHRLARHAPLVEGVDLVVIQVRLLEGLQRADGLLRQKAVVLVGALMDPGPRVLPVEEPALEPMGD